MLGHRLAGRRGPYILSDLRWGEGPLYLRYGGFAERYCRNEAGDRVLALEEPDGRLVPDVRGAGFSVPPWAPGPRGHRLRGRRTGDAERLGTALHGRAGPALLQRGRGLPGTRARRRAPSGPEGGAPARGPGPAGRRRRHTAAAGARHAVPGGRACPASRPCTAC
ncbi:class III lanthionine synthetase LanKC N-terminal domain-containing protein [Yinghuangia aomiensis]